MPTGHYMEFLLTVHGVKKERRFGFSAVHVYGSPRNEGTDGPIMIIMYIEGPVRQDHEVLLAACFQRGSHSKTPNNEPD